MRYRHILWKCRVVSRTVLSYAVPSYALLLISGLVFHVVAQPTAPVPGRESPTIAAAAIRAHMRFLSDSLLEGRSPGTRGYDIAAQYVATQQLEAIGIEPAGVAGTWFQPVRVRTSILEANRSALQLIRGGKEEALTNISDFALRGGYGEAEDLVEAPVVFVGYGVTAPELQYDDYAGVDVRGKIVAQIAGGPPRFPSTVRAYYSGLAIKARNAASHGAVGILNVGLPELEEKLSWPRIAAGIQGGALTTNWVAGTGGGTNSLTGIRAEGYLSIAGTKKLFAGAPNSLDAVFRGARASESRSFPLGCSARIRVGSRDTSLVSANVIGLLTGGDPVIRNEYVMYAAHIDHLGACPPIDDDPVCHGAADNASGVATLIEIARAFKALPAPPPRSILFLFSTEEEINLIGSDYFIHFPTRAVENIVAAIPIDIAPGLIGRGSHYAAIGAEHSTLNKNVESATQKKGLAIVADPAPEENLFIRNDGYSFVRAGVPTITVLGPVDDPAAWRDYEMNRYHTPRDNTRQPLDFEAAAEGATLNLQLGMKSPARANGRSGRLATSSV